MEREDEIPPEQEIDFCTMGMFIIVAALVLSRCHVKTTDTHNASAILLFQGRIVQYRSILECLLNLQVWGDEYERHRLSGTQYLYSEHPLNIRIQYGLESRESVWKPDEIHYLPPKAPEFDILGGAGSYSALGARLFSPPPLSKSVSWIIDTGSDFPSSISTQIRAWSTSCLIRSDPSRLTTRGWNGYDENEIRAFKYTTPKLRLDENALTSQLLFSKSFHMVCSPTRCIELVTGILRKRKAVNPYAEKPLFIWEPVPDLCTPTELLNCTNALPYVDICSPNHAELAGFIGDPDLGLDPETGEVDKQAVERACEQLLGSMPLQSFALVIRCGAKGCFVAKNGGRSRRPSVLKRKRPRNHARGGLTLDMDMEALFAGLMNGEGSFERNPVHMDPGIERWLPAVHSEGDGEEEGKPKVVDPTGGGNGFLGGLAVALARGKEVEEAAAWGSVAASFAIEQAGMPVLHADEEGRETWNGVRVQERLEEFMRRNGK